MLGKNFQLYDNASYFAIEKGLKETEVKERVGSQR